LNRNESTHSGLESPPQPPQALTYSNRA